MLSCAWSCIHLPLMLQLQAVPGTHTSAPLDPEATAPAPHALPTHRHVSCEQHWLEGVVHAKVQATVHDDTNTADGEATVQASNTVRSQGLAVHVHQAIELAVTTSLLG